VHFDQQADHPQVLHYLEREGLSLPGRLKELENRLQKVKSEMEGELVQIQIDAKSAFEQTKVEKVTWFVELFPFLCNE